MTEDYRLRLLEVYGILEGLEEALDEKVYCVIGRLITRARNDCFKIRKSILQSKLPDDKENLGHLERIESELNMFKRRLHSSLEGEIISTKGSNIPSFRVKVINYDPYTQFPYVEATGSSGTAHKLFEEEKTLLKKWNKMKTINPDIVLANLSYPSAKLMQVKQSEEYGKDKLLRRRVNYFERGVNNLRKKCRLNLEESEKNRQKDLEFWEDLYQHARIF